MSATDNADRCIRAMTNDGGLRLIAVTLEQTVSEAASAQNVATESALELAELLAGAVLLRETTQPSRRVQIALRDHGGRKLVADSLPDGLTRGLANPGTGGADSGWSKRSIEVTYTQMNGALHKGIVAIADDTNISDAMMTYLQESEQILTTISIAARGMVSSDGSLGLRAAGFVVQLLPELERSLLKSMTERLANFGDLGSSLDAVLPPTSELVDLVFEGYEYTLLADSEIRFGCNCSRQRFIAGIGTLAAAEIESMIAAGEPLELTCDACGKSYDISPEELRDL